MAYIKNDQAQQVHDCETIHTRDKIQKMDKKKR
jgi:hypothetical protein